MTRCCWYHFLPPFVSVNKHSDRDVTITLCHTSGLLQPSDKLKSESDIAEEEARKLKELEEERLRRMRGDEPPMQIQSQHRSADDLDDGFVYLISSNRMNYHYSVPYNI